MLSKKFQIKCDERGFDERGLTPSIKIKRGFTLMEVLVAIFLITVGVLGAMALVNQTTTFTQGTSSRLVAAYLAQEGIEIVRNIRDSNFLKIHKGEAGVNWDTGLTGCTGGCEADYNDSVLISADRYLKIDAGFYNYDSGLDTPFKRKITITPDGSDILKVSVEVSWQERGRAHQVTAQENLYQWWY